MSAPADVHYAHSRDGIDIAYQVLGDGPVDIAFVPGFVSHLDLNTEIPPFAAIGDHLSQIGRVLTFDKRGSGLSDRTLGFGSLEARMHDIRAVMDAAEMSEAHIFGISEGGPLAMLFTADHPDRVASWPSTARSPACWRRPRPSGARTARAGRRSGLLGRGQRAHARPPEPVLRVAAIQPGTDAGDGGEVDRNVEQTRDAAARGTQLVVWREKTLDYDPRSDRGQEMRDLARETGAYIAVGYGIDTPEGQRNEATVISPEGDILGVYGKQHPALMFADDRTSITAGDFPVYDTTVGRLATIICYDLDFFVTAGHMARNDAQVVAVPSWDPTGDATKHYPLLVVRRRLASATDPDRPPCAAVQQPPRPSQNFVPEGQRRAQRLCAATVRFDISRAETGDL